MQYLGAALIIGIIVFAMIRTALQNKKIREEGIVTEGHVTRIEEEDYMKVFENSFEEMIDNMIMKAIVSRLVGDYVQRIFDSIQAKKVDSDLANFWVKQMKLAENRITELQSAGGSEEEISEWKKLLKQAQDEYAEAITPTPEDIATIREEIEYGKVGIKEGFEALMEA
ncbi:MAG: hypothetical protein IIU06_03510, partial [Erysipelotrichales bacterium]|nr:hypothetical protein [Erysipelotrichales bacterium]